MSTLAGTDAFVVNRAGVNYQVTAANLMSTIADTDLFVVNRGTVNYQVTGLDVKAYFGGSTPLSTGDMVIGGNWIFIGYDPVSKIYWSWNQAGGGAVGGFAFSAAVYMLISDTTASEMKIYPAQPSVAAAVGSASLVFAGDTAYWGSSGSVWGKGYKWTPPASRAAVGFSPASLNDGLFAHDYVGDRTMWIGGSGASGTQQSIISTDNLQTGTITNLAAFFGAATGSFQLNQFLPNANRWVVSYVSGYTDLAYTTNGSTFFKPAISGVFFGTLAYTSKFAENADGSIIMGTSFVYGDTGQRYMRSTDQMANFTRSATDLAVNQTITAGPWFINGKFRYFNVNAGVITLWSSTDALTWTSQDVTASFPNFTPTLNGISNSVYDGTNLYLTGTFAAPNVNGIGFVSGSLFT